MRTLCLVYTAPTTPGIPDKASNMDAEAAWESGHRTTLVRRTVVMAA
ncbi:hypothetical protein EE612_027554 [Oryza sativa]|nr:hypothetical protein EE612_027554 [Oryza sativa]